jgi:hypothetical protein
MVRGELHAHDPLAVDDDAVPVLVAVHDAAQEATPEPALGLDIACVEHHDLPDGFHVSSCPRQNEDHLRVRPAQTFHVRSRHGELSRPVAQSEKP